MPHPLDRQYQQETYQKIIDSDKKFVIVQADTGSGKSAWPAQAGYDGRKSMAIAETKSLQEQYRNSYNFSVLKGKGSYSCGNNQTIRTDICHVIGHDVGFCKQNCKYYHARKELLSSQHASLNYAKFLLECGEFGVVPRYSPAILWLDEAHASSNIVTDWSGLKFQWSDWVRQYIDEIEIKDKWDQALSLGIAVIEMFRENLPDMTITKQSSRELQNEYRRVERMKLKISTTLSLVKQGKQFWYTRSDQNGFILKPLTARFHFNSLFNYAPKVVLMSATIQPGDLVDIGLTTWNEVKESQFVGDFIETWETEKLLFIRVPSIWPAPMRHIEDMKCPRMGRKTLAEGRQEQVEIIAKRISQFDCNWSGLILTMSEKQAHYLRGELIKFLPNPIYVTQKGDSTEKMLNDWQNFYKSNEGAICISWAFWEGVDLGNQDFLIVAKVPFNSFADGYDKARHLFDAGASAQRVANKLVQGLGRIRRGKLEHYGKAKFVGIADGNWTRVKGMLPDNILEAIY